MQNPVKSEFYVFNVDVKGQQMNDFDVHVPWWTVNLEGAKQVAFYADTRDNNVFFTNKSLKETLAPPFYSTFTDDAVYFPVPQVTEGGPIVTVTNDKELSFFFAGPTDGAEIYVWVIR